MNVFHTGAAAPATASAGRLGTAPPSSGSGKNSSGPDRRRRRPLHLREGAPLENDSVDGAGVLAVSGLKPNLGAVAGPGEAGRHGKDDLCGPGRPGMG